MEVILREDINNLGTRGQVVKVAPGYARNFLIPKKLAVTATGSNKKIIEQERQAQFGDHFVTLSVLRFDSALEAPQTTLRIRPVKQRIELSTVRHRSWIAVIPLVR